MGIHHRFLREKEHIAIECWNDTVPKKSSGQPGQDDVGKGQDPVVMAYLEAKLELFRSAGVGADGRVGGARTTRTASVVKT